MKFTSNCTVRGKHFKPGEVGDVPDDVVGTLLRHGMAERVVAASAPAPAPAARQSPVGVRRWLQDSETSFAGASPRRVKFQCDCIVNGRTFRVGDVYNIPGDRAAQLIRSGKVEPVTQGGPKPTPRRSAR